MLKVDEQQKTFEIIFSLMYKTVVYSETYVSINILKLM